MTFKRFRNESYIYLSILTKNMTIAQIPANEEARLKALDDFSILDTDPEVAYDELVQLAAYICGMDAAQISLIDKDRQWIKSSVGNLSQTVDRNIAFCSHTILQTDALVVEDTSLDNRFLDNPFVTQDPGLRFYAGIPLITSEGFGVGSLCVLDIKPRKLSAEQLKALQVLGKQVMKQMELRKAFNTISEQHEKLDDLNKISLRLLSIIGHDLRAPLASLTSLLDLTERGLLSKEEEQEIFGQLKSTLKTAESLLKDLLQWASSLQDSNNLILEAVSLSEMLIKFEQEYNHDFIRKGNRIDKQIPHTLMVHAEKNIIQFVFRNLLLNANKFTEKGLISISSKVTHDSIRLSVQDSGIGIEQAQINGMFDWKNRKSTIGTQGEKGSGLALLLVHDLLGKLNGKLEVNSELGKGSNFTVVLPLH